MRFYRLHLRDSVRREVLYNEVHLQYVSWWFLAAPFPVGLNRFDRNPPSNDDQILHLRRRCSFCSTLTLLRS